jgi:hypothetical protein
MSGSSHGIHGYMMNCQENRNIVGINTLIEEDDRESDENRR